MGSSPAKHAKHAKLDQNLRLGSTPSHGNPRSTSELNTELNNVARNTDDTGRARALVAAGADLRSTNGPDWRHTPLHQAAFHGRYEMAKTLVELGAPLDLHSNPCGRGATGTPLELARGGGHHKIATMLEKAAGGSKGKAAVATPAEGRWEVYKNIDMCFQGDVEIVGDWKRHTSIEKLKKIVEQKGYSAVCVGSFGHAALKSFDYQLTKDHCKPSHGYTNELHIWFPKGAAAKPPKVEVPRPALPPGFRFADGYGEATRGDQIGHITSGGVENHCFKGDKMSWPLQWAAMIGDVEAIGALLAAGHDPNVKMTDWFDSEPLGWAASFGQCRAIEALCAAGADPSRPANLSGNTPLSDAEREGHTKAISLIKEYLSGKRSVGEVHRPAVMAAGVVVGEPIESTAVATAAGEMPFFEVVEVLKRELHLSGTMKEVVEQAAEALGIKTKGNTLNDLASECARQMGVGAA